MPDSGRGIDAAWSPGDLTSLLVTELAAAADLLGVNRATLKHHADGELGDLPVEMLSAEDVAAADPIGAESLLVFDTAGATDHAHHMAATAAGLLAAQMLDLPVLGWTLPEAVAAQLNQELGATFVHLDVGARRIDHYGGYPFPLTRSAVRARLSDASRQHQSGNRHAFWQRLRHLDKAPLAVPSGV